MPLLFAAGFRYAIADMRYFIHTPDCRCAFMAVTLYAARDMPCWCDVRVFAAFAISMLAILMIFASLIFAIYFRCFYYFDAYCWYYITLWWCCRCFASALLIFRLMPCIFFALSDAAMRRLLYYALLSMITPLIIFRYIIAFLLMAFAAAIAMLRCRCFSPCWFSSLSLSFFFHFRLFLLPAFAAASDSLPLDWFLRFLLRHVFAWWCFSFFIIFAFAYFRFRYFIFFREYAMLSMLLIFMPPFRRHFRYIFAFCCWFSFRHFAMLWLILLPYFSLIHVSCCWYFFLIFAIAFFRWLLSSFSPLLMIYFALPYAIAFY